jgi:hypothetical protein
MLGYRPELKSNFIVGCTFTPQTSARVDFNFRNIAF